MDVEQKWLWFMELLDYLYYRKGFDLEDVKEMFLHVRGEQSIPAYVDALVQEWLEE